MTLEETLAGCAPNPKLALHALTHAWPQTHPAFMPCWEWTGGTNGKGYPQIRRRPNLPQHPVKLFLNAPEIRRICPTPKCVNPFHFIEVGKPPSDPNIPAPIRDLEAELERLEPKSIKQAMQLLADQAPSTWIFHAYRLHRQTTDRARRQRAASDSRSLQDGQEGVRWYTLAKTHQESVRPLQLDCRRSVNCGREIQGLIRSVQSLRLRDGAFDPMSRCECAASR
jgi:hypothetical protein